MILPRHKLNPPDEVMKRQMKKPYEPKLDVISSIRNAVLDVTDIDPYEITAFRGKEYVKARQLFMFFVRKYAKLTQYETGLILNKDHAAIAYAEKCVKQFNKIEPEYKKTFELIEKKIIRLNKSA